MVEVCIFLNASSYEVELAAQNGTTIDGWVIHDRG